MYEQQEAWPAGKASLRMYDLTEKAKGTAFAKEIRSRETSRARRPHWEGNVVQNGTGGQAVAGDTAPVFQALLHARWSLLCDGKLLTGVKLENDTACLPLDLFSFE